MKKPPDLYFPIDLTDDNGTILYQVWDVVTYDNHFQGTSLEEIIKKSDELNKIFHEGGDPHYILKGEVIT